MRKGETELHRTLKKLASQWAIEQGYTCCAEEVTLPNCAFRADVAGYRPASQKQTVFVGGKGRTILQPSLGSTVVFECKQARADLLKDSCLEGPSRERLRTLQTRRETMERLLKTHYPSAAAGDSLFQEFQSYNLETINHRGFQKLLKEIGVLQNALYSKNKFEKLVRYGCANLFYLVTHGGTLRDYELPLHWGLLVHEGDALTLSRKAVWQESPEPFRLAILQRIATKTTKGIAFPGDVRCGRAD